MDASRPTVCAIMWRRRAAHARSLGLREQGRFMKAAPGFCDMCGHHVAIRQRAHIVAEGPKAGANVLLLCPSCHIVLDTKLKPTICRALKQVRVENLPKSWDRSIYEQAAIASMKARRASGVEPTSCRSSTKIPGVRRRRSRGG